MQDENIYKMSQFADTEIKDIPSINILICYLLSKVKITVEADELYDIAVGSGIVNYFAYQESFDYLIKHGVAKERLSYKGYAYQNPIDTNDTEEGRQNNRRVEFKVISLK